MRKKVDEIIENYRQTNTQLPDGFDKVATLVIWGVLFAVVIALCEQLLK